MSYFTPDLSGAHANYRVTVDPYKLYATGQKIVFENGPVFLDTLVISFLSDADVVLEDGVDWEATDDDINTTEMSKAKLQNGSFSRILVNSIVILRDLTGGAIDVNMVYQRLYPVAYKASIIDGSVDLTPELLLDMLARMAGLESLVGGGGSQVIPSQITPVILAFDQNKTNSDNLIEDQEYVVDVFSHKSIIHPVQGAFFRDSVVVTIVDTEEVLVEGDDYLIQGVNQALTRRTMNTSGVYNFILITREMAATVAVTYHAVGGAVSPEVMADVVSQINSITGYLTDRAFLTASALQSSLLYQGLVNRITTVEDRMRSLAASGEPNYGDSTNGITRVKALAALDTQFHWYNIAKLYQVAGSEDIFQADRAKFRIHLVGGKILADVLVGVDLTLTRDQFSLSVANVVQNVGYELFGDVSDAASGIIMPQFRIIWNTDEGVNVSGIYLQIGLNLPGLTDTIAIEDSSGIESAWIFMAAGGSPQEPDDDTVTLPDGAVIWDSEDADSHQLVKTMPSVKPYRVWEGSVALNTFDLDTAVTHLLPDHFRVADVTEVQLVVLETTPELAYVITVPMISGGAGTASGRAQLDPEVGAGGVRDLVVQMTTVDDEPVINIGPANGAVWSSSDLDDHLVKYILAKVG